MNDILVLCYHAISGDWEASISVTPERFEGQIRALLERGYRGATVSEALTGPREEKTLVVTFDDAYRSVARHARPILVGLGVPGTVFVPTAFPGTERPMSWPGIHTWLGGPHEHELVPSSWSELEALADDGWEIGSHTRTHPRLPRLDDAALREELEGSRADCEQRLGIRCRSIAYPYGDCDPRVAAAARVAGYVAGCAMSRRVERHDPLLWPRVAMYERDHGRRFDLKVSPALRYARAGAAWAIRGTLKHRRG